MAKSSFIKYPKPQNSISKRTKDFIVLKVDINPNEENDLNLVNYVLGLAKKNGANTHDPSGRLRNTITKLKTRYLGELSEVIVKEYFSNRLSKLEVIKDEYVSYATHVDIKFKKDNKELTGEIRGSFPYSNFSHVIWNIFDIIGPYTTENKQFENPKEIYIRTLINMNIRDFDYNNPHTIYVVGGLPFDILKQKGKTDNFDQVGAEYLALKPIADAFDIFELEEYIKEFFNL